MHVCVVIVRQKLRHFSTWLSKWNSPIKLLWKKMKLWLATKFAAICFFFLGWVELKFGPRLWALSSPTQPGPDFGWPDPRLNLNNCPLFGKHRHSVAKNTRLSLTRAKKIPFPAWTWLGSEKSCLTQPSSSFSFLLWTEILLMKWMGEGETSWISSCRSALWLV